MGEPVVSRATSVDARVRLLAVHTHPIQYYAPLFRELACRPNIELEVLYITRPTPGQQGQGFGVPFQWDQDLLTGYRWRFLREPLPSDDYRRWSGLDAPGIGAVIREAQPEVVLLPGWNCRGLVRALLACNSLGIPALYRGDTNLWQRPAGLKGCLWTARNRLLLSRFAGFAAVGRRAHLFLRDLGVPEGRIALSPHAVDADRIRASAGDWGSAEARLRVRAELGVRPGEFLAAFVGKLESKKRPDDAIRAIARMADPAKLVVCGEGELSQHCRHVAGAVGASVVWLGFRNQSELPRLLAAADVLILPSGRGETWGLVVNEAMAVGTPCVVSDAVGCGPDLVEPGLTGEVFPVGVIPLLVEALERVRRLSDHDRSLTPRVLARSASYSLAAAVDGIERLCRTVTRAPRSGLGPARRCSVLALCEGMSFLGGMERTTMEILEYVATGGAETHCIVTDQPWFRYRIVHRAEQGGHGWSDVSVTTPLFSGERSVKWVFGVTADVIRCSVTALAEAVRRRSRTIFVSSFTSALRNWPALALLRTFGVHIVLRSGAAPAPNPKDRLLWGWCVDSVVDDHVAISDFVAAELRAKGIDPHKIRVIRNVLPRVNRDRPPSLHQKPRVIYVGQVIPGKGIMELLEALEILKRQGVTFEADLVGRFDGWEHPSHAGYKEALKRKVAELPTARILGEREDVLQLLGAASVHCCPSQEGLREGLGQVVLEAKSAGIPSVVTPSGALPEMIRHGIDGWICCGFGPEAIAEGLAHFLRDPEACRRAGEAAATWRDPAFLQANVEGQWRALLCEEA